jgi:hypothetical protein
MTGDAPPDRDNAIEIQGRMLGIFRSKAAKLREAALGLLARSEQNLLLGIFAQLRKTYSSGRSEQDCNLLCAAIVNKILGQSPTNKDGEQFLAGNRDAVEQAALELQHDELLATTVSYLYAAIIVRLSIETAQPGFTQSAEIQELANRFGFYIPNTFDICGSNNVEDCIVAIDKYAREFVRSAIS